MTDVMTALHVVQGALAQRGTPMPQRAGSESEALRQVAQRSCDEILMLDDEVLRGVGCVRPGAQVEQWHGTDTVRVDQRSRTRQVAVSRGRLRERAGDVPGSGDPSIAVRIVDDVLPRLAIVDRRVAFLARDGRDLAAGVLVCDEPAVVRALVSAFAQVWDKARPVTSQPGVPKHLAGALAMLMAGVTDEAASRRLGISHRTYARRVAELLTVLGVDSRFQAGAAAAERGWLDAARQTPAAPLRGGGI